MNKLLRRIRFSLEAMVLAVLFLPAGLQAATGCGVIKPDSTDAVAAAPDHHKVILENNAVRVLEARVPLHSKEPPHTHPWPSVFFEQTSGLSEPWKTVNIRWSEGGPSKGFESSDRDRHNLLVEIKSVDCQPAPAADTRRAQISRLSAVSRSWRRAARDLPARIVRLDRTMSISSARSSRISSGRHPWFIIRRPRSHRAECRFAASK